MVLLLAFSAALLQFSLVGRHTLTNAPRDETSLAPTPAGHGWYHLAEADPPPPYRGRAVPTDVWWNPPQATLAAVSTLVVSLLIMWIILACQHAGVRRALGPKYRDQGRLQAAVHYGTAWLILLLPACVIAACGPLADISAAAQWPIVVPPAVIYAPAAVLAIISVCGYGFGLIRVGATVPIAARTRVAVFFTLWNPLIVALWSGGAVVGLYYWMQLLVPQLGLGWVIGGSA